MQLDRRELFQILASGIALSPAFAVDLAKYQPRAFSAAQYKTLDALAELLLPAGDDGPGAREAGVAYYLDTAAHYGDATQRESWRRALDALAGADLEGKLQQLVQNEESPQTDEEKFFVAFKNAAIGAFYLSAAGRKCLGYKGDTAVSTFPGCTHAAHQA